MTAGLINADKFHGVSLLKDPMQNRWGMGALYSKLNTCNIFFIRTFPYVALMQRAGFLLGCR